MIFYGDQIVDMSTVSQPVRHFINSDVCSKQHLSMFANRPITDYVLCFIAENLIPLSVTSGAITRRDYFLGVSCNCDSKKFGEVVEF